MAYAGYGGCAGDVDGAEYFWRDGSGCVVTKCGRPEEIGMRVRRSFVFGRVEPYVSGRGDHLNKAVEVLADDCFVRAVAGQDEVPVFHFGFDGFGHCAFSGVGKPDGLYPVLAEIDLRILGDLCAHAAIVNTGAVTESVPEVRFEVVVLDAEGGFFHHVHNARDAAAFEQLGDPDDGEVPAPADVHAEDERVAEFFERAEYAGFGAALDESIGDKRCAFVDGIAAVFLSPHGCPDLLFLAFDPCGALGGSGLFPENLVDKSFLDGVVDGGFVHHGTDIVGFLDELVEGASLAVVG